jgi:hypothetical protein
MSATRASTTSPSLPVVHHLRNPHLNQQNVCFLYRNPRAILIHTQYGNGIVKTRLVSHIHIYLSVWRGIHGNVNIFAA